MNPIQTRTEFLEVLKQPQALLFLWVNWAIHACSSRLVAEKMIEVWHAQNPGERVPSYMIDVSDQCGEVWDLLTKWLIAENQPADQLMFSGAGSLLWVQSGNAVLHVLAPLRYEPLKLAAAMRSAFEADEKVMIV